MCGEEVLSPAWPGGSASAVFSQRGTSAARSDGAGEAAAQHVGIPQLQRVIGTDRPTEAVGSLPARRREVQQQIGGTLSSAA